MGMNCGCEDHDWIAIRWTCPRCGDDANIDWVGPTAHPMCGWCGLSFEWDELVDPVWDADCDEGYDPGVDAVQIAGPHGGVWVENF